MLGTTVVLVKNLSCLPASAHNLVVSVTFGLYEVRPSNLLGIFLGSNT